MHQTIILTVDLNMKKYGIIEGDGNKIHLTWIV